MILCIQSRVLVDIPNLEPEPTGVDAPVANDEEDGKARLCDKVEDAVEDGLGVRGDVVAAFAETPGDGVEEPDY